MLHFFSDAPVPLFEETWRHRKSSIFFAECLSECVSEPLSGRIRQKDIFISESAYSPGTGETGRVLWTHKIIIVLPGSLFTIEKIRKVCYIIIKL